MSNMSNRTLVDEGTEVIYNQLMSDFETDEKHFEADCWSLTVDNNFLQQHKKEVMIRQNVIYEDDTLNCAAPPWCAGVHPAGHPENYQVSASYIAYLAEFQSCPDAADDGCPDLTAREGSEVQLPSPVGQVCIIPLQNLIVRDITNQEKGMFLISTAPPVMYEVHVASTQDRDTWMKIIQQSVRLREPGVKLSLVA